MIIPACLECGLYLRRLYSDVVSTPHYICVACGAVHVSEGGATIRCGKPWEHCPNAAGFSMPLLEYQPRLAPGPNCRGLL